MVTLPTAGFFCCQQWCDLVSSSNMVPLSVTEWSYCQWWHSSTSDGADQPHQNRQQLTSYRLSDHTWERCEMMWYDHCTCKSKCAEPIVHHIHLTKITRTKTSQNIIPMGMGGWESSHYGCFVLCPKVLGNRWDLLTPDPHMKPHHLKHVYMSIHGSRNTQERPS